MSDNNKVTVRKDRQAKTFRPKIILYIGLLCIGIGCFYFFTQFKSDRAEEWLPLGIILIAGMLLVLANLMGWKLPGSEDFWLETTYIFNKDPEVLEINFSNSKGIARNLETVNLTGTDSFDFRVETKSRTVQESRVVHDPLKYMPKGLATPTGTFVDTTTKTYVDKKVILILEPSGNEVEIRFPPEKLSEFVVQLNEKLIEVRREHQ